MPTLTTDPDLAAKVATADLSRSRWALFSLALSMLMPSLDTSIANAALPTLAHTFGASFQALQWIVLAYLLAVTTLIVGAGRVGDIIGRRRLLLGGIALFTVASLLCGMAPTLWFLLAARALQGLGAAIMLALAVASVGHSVPSARIGSSMGLLGTMSALGTTLGPSLGGLLLAGAGWRAIFLINVPLGIVNFVLARRYLPPDTPAVPIERRDFDHAGILLLALVLAAFAMALTLGGGRFGWLNGALLLLALGGGIVFVRVESKASAALISPQLLRDTALGGRLVMSLLVAMVIMSTLVVGPFYLSTGLQLQLALAGLALSAGPLAAALAGLPAGRLVDRFGAAHMTLLGLAGMVMACLVLSLLPASSGLPGYLLAVCGLTASYALFQTANTSAVLGSSPPGQRGVISGLLSLSRNLGLIGGAAAMGAVFAAATTASDVARASPSALLHGLHVTFAVASVLMLAALGLAMSVRGRSEERAVRGY